MIRALLVTHDFPPGPTGGVGNFYHALAAGAAERTSAGSGPPAVEVEVLAPTLAEGEPGETENGSGPAGGVGDGFRLTRIPMPRFTPADRGRGSPLLGLPSKAVRFLGQLAAYRRGVARIAAERPIDAVVLGHAHLAFLAGAVDAPGRSVGTFLHGSEFARYSGLPFVESALTRALATGDFLVTNSRFTRDQYRRRGVPPSTAAEVVHPGVDTDRFTPDPDRGRAYRRRIGTPEGRVVFATVARMDPWKGQGRVLEALARADLPDFEYWLGGTGPDRAHLEAEVRRLGLDDRVRWLGFVPEEDLADLYRAADVFALTSGEIRPGFPIEGFGMVLVEAGACGTPVVGIARGGMVESVVEGATGLLARPGDPADLAACLERLAGDPDLRARLGAGGAERARDLSWPNQTLRFVQAIERQVLRIRGGRGSSGDPSESPTAPEFPDDGVEQ